MQINRRKFKSVMISLSSFQSKKTFIVLTLCFIFLIIIMGSTISNVESLTSSTNEHTRIEQLVKRVSISTYENILRSEIKAFPANNTVNNFYGTGYELDSFFSRMFTGIEMRNLQTIIYQELPGFSIMAAELIGERSQLDIYAPPVETAPSDYLFKIDEGEGEQEEKNEHKENTDDKKDEHTEQQDPGGTLKKPPILIYHTHNREAYLPELDNAMQANQAYHATKNITLVGKHLSDRLEEMGIPTIHSVRDYWPDLPYGEYWRSYTYSKEEVEKILARYDSIPFIFDIHRDSASRNRTTVDHKGETYAAVWFIIGQLNSTWQFNYQFAAQIEGKVEAKVPGISRGIWAKKSGHYNQDLSKNNVLIEIGGVDNNLEEAKRTANVLAEIIAELYWEEIAK